MGKGRGSKKGRRKGKVKRKGGRGQGNGEDEREKWKWKGKRGKGKRKGKRGIGKENRGRGTVKGAKGAKGKGKGGKGKGKRREKGEEGRKNPHKVDLSRAPKRYYSTNIQKGLSKGYSLIILFNEIVRGAQKVFITFFYNALKLSGKIICEKLSSFTRKLDMKR